jgi:hypothetical protein
MTALLRHSFELELIVRSPILCSGLSPAGVGLDAAFMRDENGGPIIPSDHLKGLISESLDAIGDTAVERGCAAADGDWSPYRSNLLLGDLKINGFRGRGDKEFSPWIESKFGNKESRLVSTRVEIADETGAAKSGALHFIELIAPYDSELSFVGRLIVFSALSVNDVKAAIEKALALIPAVGAHRTLGWGEIAAFRIENKPARSLERAKYTGENCFQLKVDRPLMVDVAMLERNVFRSGATIPGGAIKGALASALSRSGALNADVNAALSALKFSHAFPLNEDGDTEGLTAPFNIVRAGIDHVDLFSYPSGESPLVNGKVPIFQVDWKDEDFAKVAARLGGATKQEHKRLQRTRIDADNETQSAEESMLFVYQSYPSLREGLSRRWRFSVCAREGAALNVNAVDLVMNALCGELDALGKTDAIAFIEPIDDQAPPKLYAGGRHDDALTLITPGLILNGGAFSNKTEAYTAFWREVFDDPGLELEAYARETLAGGYQSNRFRRADGLYRPWLLTLPGSSFRFEFSNSKGERHARRMEQLEINGLPLPSWGADFTWRTCPFVPENGYGEVRRTPIMSAVAAFS